MGDQWKLCGFLGSDDGMKLHGVLSRIWVLLLPQLDGSFDRHDGNVHLAFQEINIHFSERPKLPQAMSSRDMTFHRKDLLDNIER